MPGIERVEVSSPQFRLDKDQLTEVAGRWLANDEPTREKYIRISKNCGVESRFFIQPYSNILDLPGLKSRAEIFEKFGEPLLRQAVEKCLQNSRHDPAEFSHLLFSSCSVPVIPSVDATLILNTNLSNSIGRIPVFQHGCVGGVVGLTLGHQLAGLGKPVILTSLEICSLVFQNNNTAGSQLVGASIFADGAASMIIDPNQGVMNYIDSFSYLIPDSRRLMGYDIYDDGFHLRLDRDLPSVLVEEAPGAVGSFLNKHGLNTKDIDYWLFHPGGKKILDFFESKFELESSQCHWARDVLREQGNMSSATIFFVIERFLKSPDLKKGQKILVLGIGPGLTIELVLFEI